MMYMQHSSRLQLVSAVLLVSLVPLGMLSIVRKPTLESRRSSSSSNSSSYWCEARTNLSRLAAALVPAVQLNHVFSRADWERFEAFLSCPPGRPLVRYGQNDGSKLLCRLGNGTADRGCLIYSLGSNGDFQFEQAVLQHTSCEVHTFDCTYNGQSVHPTRHHYHKWCLGAGEGNFRSWNNITQSLGHTRVDLLKMDIEGFEYPVLASFEATQSLPDEISLELHVNVDRQGKPFNTPGQLAWVFRHLADLGYGAYAREVNPVVPDWGSEYSLIRVPPGVEGC